MGSFSAVEDQWQNCSKRFEIRRRRENNFSMELRSKHELTLEVFVAKFINKSGADIHNIVNEIAPMDGSYNSRRRGIHKEGGQNNSEIQLESESALIYLWVRISNQRA